MCSRAFACEKARTGGPGAGSFGFPPGSKDSISARSKYANVFFPRISSPFSFSAFCGSLCFPLTRQRRDIYIYYIYIYIHIYIYIYICWGPNSSLVLLFVIIIIVIIVVLIVISFVLLFRFSLGVNIYVSWAKGGGHPHWRCLASPLVSLPEHATRGSFSFLVVFCMSGCFPKQYSILFLFFFGFPMFCPASCYCVLANPSPEACVTRPLAIFVDCPGGRAADECTRHFRGGSDKS